MAQVLQRFSLAVPLALAIGVPFLLTSESTEPLRGTVGSWWSPDESALPQIEGIADPRVQQMLALSEKSVQWQASAAGTTTPVANLEGILRFDISPRWILDNWPHVATTRADDELDGLRVPLITGTRPHDVAGSLTYYFDKQHVVQRIALDGIVGDERHLVSVVTRLFQLQPDPHVDARVFVSKWNGRPTSALWIHRLPVVSADSPYQKFEFALELNRPNHYFGLSPLFRARLEHAQARELDPATTR
jgi:hypothetical protein